MTFLTNKQQELLNNHVEELRDRINELQAQLDFQLALGELQRLTEEALGKPSPPYKPTPRGCGLVEERLCDNMNK